MHSQKADRMQAYSLSSLYRPNRGDFALSGSSSRASRRSRQSVRVYAAGNTFGHMFRVTTFGESHGGGVGCVVDGVPARLNISQVGNGLRIIRIWSFHAITR